MYSCCDLEWLILFRLLSDCLLWFFFRDSKLLHYIKIGLVDIQ